jgi:two-component system chemotaxis response regulator CheY
MNPNAQGLGSPIETVLVIDDDEFFRGFLKELLRNRGYIVWTAEDGKKGLEKFRDHEPDLVLTDIIMPETEGMELIKQIKSEKPESLIIAMTGGGNYGLCGNYLQLAGVLGAAATLVKPFLPEALFAEIDKLGCE